ncbi:MAG: dihydroorotate dehydrogenase electron transfer subunit [Eubacteriales bacterium]
MAKMICASVFHNKRIAKDIFELKMYSSDLKNIGFVPGQFVNIKIPDSPDLMLLRPMSINSYDALNGFVTCVYQIAGEGTRRLSYIHPKDNIDILLPLGNGFNIKQSYKKILLIGGGVGVSPLRAVAETKKASFDAVLGFKSKDYACQLDEFSNLTDNLIIATEDGSMGVKGFVTDALNTVKETEYDAVFICGPRPMAGALKRYFSASKLKEIFISMEERMGCGTGGCAVCACKIKRDGHETYLKVCKDGPVFSLSEVVL